MKISKMYQISLFIILFTLFSIVAYGEPVKKVPAKEGNFEVIMGSMVVPPIDKELMRGSIIKAATNLGWVVEGSEAGIVTLKLEKPNSWWVIIKVCYTDKEYWYEYVDSYNLGAKPKSNKIHKNYIGRWIPNLEKHIYSFYTNPEAKARVTVISETRIASDFTNVEGKSVITPIDVDKFKTAALKAIKELGWQLLEEKSGEIRIRHSSNDWWVIVKIVYNKDGYNYIYEDSHNLRADVERKTIHKNYLARWIPNLEKFIAVNYF